MRTKAKEKVSSSKWLLVCLVAVAVILIIKFANVSFQMFRSQSQIAALKSDLEQLQEHQKELQGLEHFFQSDYFAEREARLRYGMQKKGEKTVILKQSEPQQKLNQDVIAENHNNKEKITQPFSNSLSWWLYFFGASQSLQHLPSKSDRKI